jgi:fatty acid CoA ligase FadD9
VARRLDELNRRNDDENVVALLMEELRRIALRHSLRGYEVPRGLIIEPQPFSNAQGLVTETHKLSRPRLKARYGERLSTLYAALDVAREARVQAASRDVTRSRTERAEELLAASLGVSVSMLQELGGRFAELGGDSLAAVRLTSLLRDVLAFDVPLEVIVTSPDCREALLAAIHSGGNST